MVENQSNEFNLTPTSRPDNTMANNNTPKNSSWFAGFDYNETKNKIIDSPYSGCARESFMWGIATGTAMGL